MTVVGLHPEELFDKLLEGELSPAERERLRQHLEGCEVCRFEYAARADFEREALSLGSSPPPLMPVRIRPAAALPVRRRRRRLLMWGLAAAALITASGAVASVLGGRPVWQSVSLLVSARVPAAPAQQPQSAKVRAPEQVAPALALEPAPAAALEEPTTSAGPVVRSARIAAAQKGLGAKVQVPSATKEPVAAASKELASREPAAKEPAPAAKLFAEANQARRAGDFGRAAGLYHLLQDQYPGSAEAELSRVTLALLQLDSGDARGALTGFERYLAGSSRGLEAEALVGRARALGRLGRRDLEALAWQEVQRKYPRSIYGRQASERLLALGQP
jgi:TolA-binding protein